ncbi:MAG: 50S ribosomal protein L15 [Patescibacteria group bacterium]
MTLSLANLKPARGATKKKKRVGRGNSSGHGTYSTRGLKGQRARSGVGGLKLKGLKARLQKIPKLPGFKSLYPKKAVVNIIDLDKTFTDGSIVTPQKLEEAGLISQAKFGVKVLGQGSLKKKLVIKGCLASQTAKEAIEKAGGKIYN